MAEIKLTRDNFQREVLQAEVPVLVDFWAAWCGPCRMLSPVISEIAAQAEGKYKVGKVNVDEEPELAAAYRISSIPTLLVFRDGKAAASSVGVQSRDDIEDMQLVAMYAGWLWRKRDTGDGMPRNLRWMLNNRIFSEKMREN